MPSLAEVDNFQQLMLKLGAAAVAAVTAMWRNAEADQVRLVYAGTVDPFISGAAMLTAQWYQDLKPDAAFAVETPPPPVKEILDSSAGWAFSQADPLGALVRSTERHVFTASRDTVVSNARREGVRFARYASANACAWCRVLATREAVYKTADNATKGHDNCHCLAVPVRAGDSWTPPPYVKQWMADYNTARGEVGGNLNDIVNHMRRNP